jgi:D-alanyl-D-alanine carboxypeptidase/D-alanyl-D-alanine-endopeptidase (penicillin-binding protein 4)
MRARAALVVMIVALLVSAPATASADSLSGRMSSSIRRSGVSSTSSVYVWDQSSRRVVYSRAAMRPMAPASTIKLMTSAAALARFGPEHRFTTTVALNGKQAGSTFVGDVWLIGGGDPSLSTFGFRRDNYRHVGTNMAGLVTPLRKLGITTVRGSVRVDDDLFDEVRYVPEWKTSFRYEETGALGALTVNQAQLGRWVGTRSSRIPDVHAGETYRDLLKRQGIDVSGTTRPGSVPSSAEVAGMVQSPPLEDLLAYMDSTSSNFFAEIMLKGIGADRFAERGDGSTSDGRRAARAELVELGVDMRSVRWVDGSGLAYSNRVSARSLGHVLGIGAQTEWGEGWIRGLANNGRTGTLRGRMTRRPYYGRVYAKTGTLNIASGLAGFAHRVGSNRRFGFVVLTNGWRGGRANVSRARTLQDRIAMTLVR